MSADEFRSEENDKEISCATANDDHLFRLFVGWVPKLFVEKDLKPFFEQCGTVQDLIILKDKSSGQPRGCAFVSYATKEEAEEAISKLDKKVQLSGALSPLEVRFARSHQYIQAGPGPEDNKQLFFARAPASGTVEDLKRVFSQFGEVDEINLFRERRTHLSKGCGFVTMATRDQAMKAMEALDEKVAMQVELALQLAQGSVGPMAVKWADPELQSKKKKAVQDSNAENRMLFFAKVLRSATEDEVKGLFSQHGKVYEVNLFRAFQGAPTTKGCGLVTMGTHAEAAAAIEYLDNKHTWDGMDSPMVVKWMDAQLQKRRREEHLAAMRQGLIPSMGMGPDVWMPAAQALAYSGAGSLVGRQLLRGAKLEMHEPPPPGCAPDAIKLFVGNIPKSYTEEQLTPVFETVGKVIELVIVRDKQSHESKGSAFVWYQTRRQAEQAIIHFNIRHVLPDPTGEQDRPLVVRRANSRQRAQAISIVPHVDPHSVLGDVPVHIQPALTPMMQLGLRGMPVGSGGYKMHGMGPLLDSLGEGGMSGGSHYDPSSFGGHNPLANMSTPGIRGVGAPLLYEPYDHGRMGNEVGQQMTSSPMMDHHMNLPVFNQSSMPPNAMPEGGLGQFTLSMHLNGTQMQVINSHLYSIQTMSGAAVRIAPGGVGVFYLMISGSEAQVDAAKGLISTVLNQQPSNNSLMG